MNLESNQFQMNFYFDMLYFTFNYLVQSIIVQLKKKNRAQISETYCQQVAPYNLNAIYE